MPTRKRTSKIRSVAAKELSVLAWIQDAYGQVLLVQQTAGRQLWSLPGGKVRSDEPLKVALRREIKEEIGLAVTSSRVADLFDRPERKSLAVLFHATVRQGALKPAAAEIRQAVFVGEMPRQATPSLRHFWRRQFSRDNGRGHQLDF
jgi:ADP-ribose pyrophosphatase YjhB (NUDIX family)